MKDLVISDDIQVYFIKATSFPEGITQAFDAINSVVASEGRTLYGLSRAENQGGIVYRACVEVKDGDDPLKFGLPTMTIRKGNYISETISDFRSKMPMIFDVFKRLLANPRLDPDGYCVERYPAGTEDVICMVRLID